MPKRSILERTIGRCEIANLNSLVILTVTPAGALFLTQGCINFDTQVWVYVCITVSDSAEAVAAAMGASSLRARLLLLTMRSPRLVLQLLQHQHQLQLQTLLLRGVFHAQQLRLHRVRPRNAPCTTLSRRCFHDRTV